MKKVTDDPTWLFEGRDYTRQKVRIRDKHTCQMCGVKWQPPSRRFDVHHLNGLCGKKSRGYDSVSDTDGLITLCHRCHISTHPKRKARRVLPNHREKVFALRAEGKSYDFIGKKFKVSSQAVYFFINGRK